jgi:uncharacterized membrane protein YfcA
MKSGIWIALSSIAGAQVGALYANQIMNHPYRRFLEFFFFFQEFCYWLRII